MGNSITRFGATLDRDNHETGEHQTPSLIDNNTMFLQLIALSDFNRQRRAQIGHSQPVSSTMIWSTPKQR
uniref:Uncharacterized protein n=1 Tax=Arundo donax TaxID=35708 RepID=A0A0A9CQF8_ARUDO